jgi:hypothetical protein
MAEEEEKKNYHPADSNGDGNVSKEEEEMYLEFKRKELEDADAMRDAQRGVYFIAVAGIVAAFFGAQAFVKKTETKK